MTKFNSKSFSFLIIGFLTVITFNAFAQNVWKPGDPIEIKFGKGDSAFTIQPMGVFRLLMVYSDKQLYASDLGTRVGFNFNQPVNARFSIFGHIELALHIMSNNENFTLSPSNSTEEFGFNQTAISNPDKVFGMRQTYLGLDFKQYGKVTFGKQNSAYKILGDRTDITEANSGFANYVFSPSGSDGGITGTGRANSCLTYANRFLNRINFACSGVFELNSGEDSLIRPVDAASVSAIVDIYKGFDLAIAYNRTFLSKSTINNQLIYGLKNDPEYLMIGAEYQRKNFLIAVNYITQKYGDLANQDYADTLGNSLTRSVVYSGTGLEIAAQYIYKKWLFQTGVNLKDPEQDENQLMNAGFQTHFVFYSFQYYPVKNLAFYFEGRIENSKNVNGDNVPGANVIGLTYRF